MSFCIFEAVKFHNEDYSYKPKEFLFVLEETIILIVDRCK